MHKNQLNEKVALITGAARRVGKEIALTLHAAGMNIVIHYNESEPDAKKLCHALNQKRQNSAVMIQNSLGDAEKDKILIENAFNIWKRLDILVNNASRFYPTPLSEATDYAWKDLMDSNLKAPFFLSKAAVPFLAMQEGVIINITDIHAEAPLRDYAIYCISKSGLVMMTKLLAKELGPKVRVNAVAPGAILWPEGENNLPPEIKEKIINETVLKRQGHPRDIAKAVLFLVRDADYVTGQVINVDGGRYI